LHQRGRTVMTGRPDGNASHTSCLRRLYSGERVFEHEAVIIGYSQFAGRYLKNLRIGFAALDVLASVIKPDGARLPIRSW
jgi:hypothetical protein